MQVNNMGFNIHYDFGANKIKFHINVNGFNLAEDSDSENILLDYYYDCYLESMEFDFINGEYKLKNGPCGLPECINYFRQPLQIKDVVFFTDLLIDYMYLGNKYNIKQEQLNDYEFLNKLRNSYRKIDKLQEDFK